MGAASATATASTPAACACSFVCGGAFVGRLRRLQRYCLVFAARHRRRRFVSAFFPCPVGSAAIIFAPVWPLAFALAFAAPVAVANFARPLSRAGCRGALNLVGLVLIFEFKKIGYIEEGVAFKAQVDKCRLHAGEHAGYATVVNGAREGVFIFAFVIDLCELIVFKNRKPRFMRR
jgi:hypothetical protein